MQINPSWRIGIVGDGDLSFTRSLAGFHDRRRIWSSIYDSFSELENKYGSQHYDWLVNSDVSVFEQVDVSDASSIPVEMHKQCDLVIFQFPLIPGFLSKDAYHQAVGDFSTNTLNRLLIFNFLKVCQQILLDPDGEGLCFVTSKDVKPYSDWNIENISEAHPQLHFIGQKPFDVSQFPGYRIRNVNKDNFVRDTEGTTYAWSVRSDTESLPDFTSSPKHLDSHCRLCGEGPLKNNDAQKRHQQSKSHQRKLRFEKQWLKRLAQEGGL